MSVLGWFLAVVGLVGLVVGLLQMLKGKKLNAVPFRAPSQIAQLGPGAADAKGMVSTEGTVGQQGLLIAPMSGKPCLAFELTVNRKWEKSEMTENGAQTKKGSDKVFGDYKGAIFPLQDAQGTVLVDATAQPDVSMEKSHGSEMTVGLLGIPSMLQFGGFTMGTPSTIMSEGRTLGFEGVEKIIPPSPTLYALGALAMGPQGPVLHTPRGIGTGKLILSTKGRASLVGSTKRNMILGYALGGVMFVGGTLLGIFGPAPAPSASNSCTSTLSEDTVSCDGRLYASNGDDYKWTVPAAGEYTVSLKQPKVKFPIDGTLTITDAKGNQVAYNDGGSPGAEAKVTHDFEAGTYTVNVRDFSHQKVKGGFGYHLEITKTEAPAVSSATITAGSLPAASAATPASKVNAKLPAGAKAAAKPAAAASAKPAATAAATANAPAPGKPSAAAPATAAPAAPAAPAASAAKK
jgi:E3 Ubiquitin ligase